MIERFRQFPAALASAVRSEKFGEVPALLAHPDWRTPAPTMIWMHGRTVNKELDPGRYLRWLRAGIATCALDLPGHGERFIAEYQTGAKTPEMIAQMAGEIDGVVRALGAMGVFDMRRLGIGGMSAGGMVTLRRLCEPHGFRCAAVECTTGNLGALYFPEKHGLGEHTWKDTHTPAQVAAVDPMEHLSGFAPMPILILHGELDALVPWETQRRFVEAMKVQYVARGASESLIEVRTFGRTGAPQEHAGFGVLANEAKNTQLEFLTRRLMSA